MKSKYFSEERVKNLKKFLLLFSMMFIFNMSAMKKSFAEVVGKSVYKKSFMNECFVEHVKKHEANRSYVHIKNVKVSPLNMAIGEGDLESIDIHHKYLFVKDSKDRTPLGLILFYKKNKKRLALDLLDALICSVKKHYPEELGKFVNQVLKFTYKDSYSTVLNIAISNGDIDIAKKLINAGADITLSDRDGETVLHKAILTENIELVSIIAYKVGKKINDVNNEKGRTALQLLFRLIEGSPMKSYNLNAKRLKLPFVLKALGVFLKCGAKLNVRDFQGRNVLHWLHFTKEGRQNIKSKLFKVLIAYSKSVNNLFEALFQESTFQKEFGKTPFDLILEKCSNQKGTCIPLMRLILGTQSIYTKKRIQERTEDIKNSKLKNLAKRNLSDLEGKLSFYLNNRPISSTSINRLKKHNSRKHNSVKNSVSKYKNCNFSEKRKAFECRERFNRLYNDFSCVGESEKKIPDNFSNKVRYKKRNKRKTRRRKKRKKNVLRCKKQVVQYKKPKKDISCLSYIYSSWLYEKILGKCQKVN